jgi:putative redox protein
MSENMRRAHVKWVEDFKFVGTSNSGRSIVMDSSASGGKGGSSTTPGELIFLALGGCTGIDVVSLLEKMRVPFRDLRIDIEGETVAADPKIYKWIKLIYRFYGVADKEKAGKAVALSQEKYCSVSAIVKKSTDFSFEIVFED